MVYDRIYVGAGCDEDLKERLLGALSLGGVLVAPVGDHLLKIRRVDDSPLPHSNFVATVLSGVRFVPLIGPPAVPAATFASPSAADDDRGAKRGRATDPLRAPQRMPLLMWTPTTHAVFPLAFKRSALALLMAGGRAQAPLPQTLWFEVLAFTSRCIGVRERRRHAMQHALIRGVKTPPLSLQWRRGEKG
jgi:hypothetical protein